MEHKRWCRRWASATEGQKRGGTLAKIRFWIKSAEQEIANTHLLIEDARRERARAGERERERPRECARAREGERGRERERERESARERAQESARAHEHVKLS